MAVPRILLISSNSSARGGGERYLVYLTQALTEVGCNVSALLSDVDYMDGWARSLAEAGADVHRLPLLGLRSRPLRILQSISDRGQQQAIAAFCRELAPQAILVNQQYDEDGLDFVAGALAAEVAPVAGVMHMPMTATKDSRPLGRWRGKLLQRWYRRHPYRLALVSEGSRREFEQYYDRPRPTYVLHHGCTFPSDNAESAAGMDKPDLPPEWSSDVPTVAFLGQLVPQKNLLLTADAWVWTRQQGVRSRLLLVGDGSEREAIARRLTAAPVPETDWYVAGWQPDPELYYQAMDVYATTSH
ncbi:MAG: glycosyltransferase, partial [Cyanobacteria bacterium J06639_1]